MIERLRARIVFCDPRKFFTETGALKAVTELADDSAAALVGVDVIEVAGDAGGMPMLTKKVKFWDKIAAIDKAMRYLGLLNDRIEHTGKDGWPVTIITATDFAEIVAKYDARTAAGS